MIPLTGRVHRFRDSHLYNIQGREYLVWIMQWSGIAAFVPFSFQSATSCNRGGIYKKLSRGVTCSILICEACRGCT